MVSRRLAAMLVLLVVLIPLVSYDFQLTTQTAPVGSQPEVAKWLVPPQNGDARRAFWGNFLNWASRSLQTGYNLAQIVGGTFTSRPTMSLEVRGMIPLAHATTTDWGVTTTGSTSYPSNTFGDTTAESGYDNGGTASTNTLRAIKYSGGPLTVTSIYIDFGNVSTSYTAYCTAFVYSDSSGYPGTKQVESASQNVQTPGFRSYSVTATYLASGAWWIGANCYVSGTTIARILNTTGTTNQFYTKDGSYGGSSPSSPATFPSGAAGAAYKSSVYVTGPIVESGFTKGTRVQFTDSTTSTGAVTSFSFYTHTGGASDYFVLAFYDDSGGSPYHRLWYSSSTGSASSTWNTVNYNSGTVDNGWAGMLTQYAYYWFVWQWSSADSGPSYAAGSSSTGIYLTQTYACTSVGCPRDSSSNSTWSGGTLSNENWSMYATYAALPNFGTATIGSTSYPTYTFGDSAMPSFDGGGTGGTNLLRAFKFSLSAPLTTTKMSVVWGNAGPSYNCYTTASIYSDSSGYPGSKLGESASRNIQAQGWYDYPLTVYLATGTYWLATNTYVDSGLIGRMYYEAGSSNQEYYKTGSYGGSSPNSPATFPSGATGAAQSGAIYATGAHVEGYAKATKAALTDNNAQLQGLRFYSHSTGNFRPAVYANAVYSVTSANGASLDTSQSVFGGASGHFVSSSSQYLTVPDSPDWNFGTGSFTIDFRIRFSTLATTADNWYMIWCQNGGITNSQYLGVTYTSGSWYWSYRVWSGGSNIISIDKATTLSTNTWYHVALVRSGNNWYWFQNGSQVGTTSTSASSVPDFAASTYIAYFPNYSLPCYFPGWLDEFRISTGNARWTSNFTPPASAYSGDINTNLLLHMDGSNGSTTFTDSSTAGSTGVPGAKLWEGGSTAAAASTWNTANISAGNPTSLTLNGGYYWLAWQWDSANSGPSYTLGSAGDGNYMVMSYSAYPSSWIGGTSTSEKWSIYLTYTLASQVAMTVSYQINGGGSPIAPVFNYVQGGSQQAYTLTGAATQIMVDMGSNWSVTPNPLTGSGSSEQWYSSQTLSGTVTSQASVFTFYHQYAQTLSYGLVGAGSPTPPAFTANRSGVSTQQTITTTPTGYWFDAGASWAVTNPLGGSSGTEQWETTPSSGGSLNSASTMIFSYQHQYKLTMNTGTGGSVTPATGWQNETAVVAINATPSGSGYSFASWTGSGTGSYNGTANPSSVTMSGAITETASFNQIVQITVASSPAGGGYVIVDGIPITTPQTYSWVVGASHNLTATSSAISCGSGCQLVWQSWSDTLGRSHLITVPSSTTTYTATFKTQYQLTLVANPSSWGTTTPPVGTYWYDSGSIVPVNATASSGYSFASWSDNGAKSHSVTVSQAGTLTANFVSVVVMTASYSVTGGGSPTAPSFACVQLGIGHQFILSGTPTQITCDAGTAWSVTPNPLTGSGASERWISSQTLNGTASTQTLVFTFYHQYKLALSYSVSDGAGFSAPTFTATRYESSTPETLSSPASYWYDAGSSWSLTNPLGGSGSSERWYTLHATSGTITSADTIVFNYAHQFSLTMTVTPPGGGTTTPSSGWENKTASVQISASASGGYAFVSWSGSGDTCYNGTNNPAFVEMNGPITETASFVRPVDHFVFSTVTSQVAGVPFQVTITAIDAVGGTVTSYAGTNTLSDTTGTITPTGTSPFSSGVWAGNVTITKAQSGVTISTSGGGKTGTSNSFTIDSAVLDHFAFDTIGSPQTAGTAFSVTVTAVDANGNIVIGYTGTNTLTVSTGTISPTTTTGGFSSGVWTGSVTVSTAGTGETISTSGSGKSGTSDSFIVNPGALDHFTFATITSPQTAGTSFSILITAKDLNGNTVNGYAGPNALSISAGTVSPNETAPFSNGLWTGSVTLGTAGTGLTIITAGGGKSGTSNAFTVNPALGTMTVSYQVVGGGTGYLAPTFNYVQGGQNKTQSLTGTPTGVSCDEGSAWSVTHDPLGGSSGSERWYSSQTLSGTASIQTLVFTFYRQYMQTLSYSITGGGTGYTAPTYTASRNGASAPEFLTDSAAGCWYDSGSSWSVTDPLGGSGGSERWYTSQTISGTITSATTAVFTYSHQFYLTVLVSPPGSGAPSPVSSWRDANSSVQMSASPSGGYTFSSWTCTGSGCYSGTNNPATISSMTGAMTETANFVVQSTMTVSYQISGGGTGYSAPTFNYVQGGQSKTYTLTGTGNATLVDPASSWSVTPNPLTGSGTSERWYSSQTLSGTASAQTLVFTFQHQFYLTMQVSPTGAGSTTPTSGWKTSGNAITISASPGNGYVFSSWGCTGPGCYSGSNNPASVTVGGETMETALFNAQVTMTLSYAISGGGLGYSAPTFHYVQNGTDATYEFTGTATGIQCDVGSAWSVTSNPLTGSGSSERWYSGQVMSGTASAQTLVFTFQHQFYLTMQVNPFSSGITLPTSGWQNSGASIGISATASGSNYSFMNWTGTGSGNYTGASNPSSITLNGSIVETANFVGQVTMTVSYTVLGGGTGYSPPIFVYSQSGEGKNVTLTGTPAVVVADAGSAWAVTPCPLSGSSTYERWYSSQALVGSASGQALVISFQHQFYLSVLVGSSGGGSVSPASGWVDAGSSVTVSATAASGYVFVSWSGSGSGSYSGTNSTATMTVGDSIVETAEFGPSGPVQVTLFVSYQIIGGGAGYSPPIFNYIRNGVGKQSILNQTAGGVQCDSGSVRSVSSNPLIGSTSNERWYSTQALNGTASAQTLAFTFQHQYVLTMGVSPSGGGSTTPITGWQNAGSFVSIASSSNPGFSFHDWSGSGSGSYSGSSNPSNVTITGAITEVADFVAAGPGQVTMTVNYATTGGGTPTAPVFNYMQGGISRHATLNQTASGVPCDSGTSWAVTPNPLSGSDASERWISAQALSGTASTQSKTFSFQHQYMLTVQVSPSGAGSATPTSGWQSAGATVHLSASAHLGHAFQIWTGSGTSSYSGSNNPATITLNGAVTETADFTTSGSTPVGTACTFSSSASITVGVPVFSLPQGASPLSPQQLLLPLSQVLPASGLVVNRRARRGMKRLLFGSRRGGLSGLTSAIVLVILVASAIIGVAAYYYGIGGGATSQSHMIFSGSLIKVNPQHGTGTVYIKLYNEGAGSVRVRSINVTAEGGNFGLDFSSGMYGVVSAPNCNCTISSGQGVGMGGSSGNGFLNLPAGTTTSVLIVFNSGMTDYFTAGTRYQAVVVPVQAAEMPFSIPSEGGQ